MLTMSKICGIINDSYGDIADELKIKELLIK